MTSKIPASKEYRFGMSKPNFRKLVDILTFKAEGPIHDEADKMQSVAEYIATHDVKTERRVSKRGIDLIKVYYPSGKVAEYEVANLERTTAFEE